VNAHTARSRCPMIEPAGVLLASFYRL
jgi:hypothetical protein